MAGLIKEGVAKATPLFKGGKVNCGILRRVVIGRVFRFRREPVYRYRRSIKRKPCAMIKVGLIHQAFKWRCRDDCRMADRPEVKRCRA